MPFHTQDAEGFDVNSPYDWDLAEHLVKQKAAKLCTISLPPYFPLANG